MPQTTFNGQDVMLAGVDNSTQSRDIRQAQRILQQLEFES